MHPSVHCRTIPDKPAVLLAGTGEVLTYAALEARSNQAAHLWRRLGLRIGDTIAFLLENTSAFMPLVLSAQRSGLYYTCVSTKLSPEEVEYIIKDCGARILVISAGLSDLAERLAPLLPRVGLLISGDGSSAFQSLETALEGLPTYPVEGQMAGADMLYSSGTTGRPKGIRPKIVPNTPIDEPTPLTTLARRLFGFGAQTVFLSPAPLYHAAPLRWCMLVQRLGGTVVIMERFEADAALAAIEKYRVTASQWVPTHFTRMLRLPADVRSGYDLSSLRVAIHAAAPCPVSVKEAMMQWWGPILYEYYSGTEGVGFTAITAEEWLTHKGSVGRAVLGEIKICDDAGDPVEAGQSGLVYFAGGPQFEYHNDPEKTSAATNKHGWVTLGDVGYLDREGYLYLTDRKTFMIISGGVNIYPQEIENILMEHPKVADVAVVGAPDEEWGEKVVAVVQPTDWTEPQDALRDELMAFARMRLSHVKTPRLIDFMRELPRQATGKLYKRLIRDAYWGKEASRGA